MGDTHRAEGRAPSWALPCNGISKRRLGDVRGEIPSELGVESNDGRTGWGSDGGGGEVLAICGAGEGASSNKVGTGAWMSVFLEGTSDENNSERSVAADTDSNPQDMKTDRGGAGRELTGSGV